MSAPEDMVGLFMSHLLLAPTLTTIRDGRVAVPVINLVGTRVKLPARELFGTWATTTDDMKVLEMTGSLTRDRVKQWL